MTTRSNSPYIPSFIKATFRDTKPVQLTQADAVVVDSNISSDESFKYDPLDYPIKNTQQLNVDWARFENHCFFSSAEVKVNEAFNRVINGFPFDGTKKEVESFLDSLTGFEKWIFDSFPRWSGALHFSGTQVGEDPSGGYPAGLGTWISVEDKSGALIPEISKNNRGESIINPNDDDSFTFESLIELPQKSNGTQIIFQKSSSERDGISFHLESTTSTTYATGVFTFSSGSTSNSVSAFMQKGSYNHVCLTLNKLDPRGHVMQFFVNESLAAESEYTPTFKKISADRSPFLIGSGSSFYSNGALVVPQQTLSGTVDELRVFHGVRDIGVQSLYSSRGLYSMPQLKLYYRFNEPSGILSNGNPLVESIVLDSSGNSLHANINNFTPSLRTDLTLSKTNPMVNESSIFKIILFPAFKDVVDLNLNLLMSASEYDRNNPNNIIKLIPRHYLLEGASQDGFAEMEGRGGGPYGGSGVPGQGQQGSVQIILSFLYIWSKFFDEIKTYVDAFGTLRTVRYESDMDDTVPDNFLEDLVRASGFYLPKFFTHATVEQFAEGQNIPGLTDLNTPLKKIQAILTRHALVSINDVIKSKGTQHSIRSFLRSIGIDPDNSLRIREYGGPTTRQIVSSREKRFEPGAVVEFTSSSFICTPPLSASRVEPGVPIPAGNFIVDSLTGRNTGTTVSSDGLLTSGSWHLESIFKIPPQKIPSIADSDGNQSLMRMFVTGSGVGIGTEQGLVLNVVATQAVERPNTPATLKAFLRPGDDPSSPMLKLNLELLGQGIFDGDRWNISVGCVRPAIGSKVPSSSYYLRAARIDSGDVVEVQSTSSYFHEVPMSEFDSLREKSTVRNASGSYVCIGAGIPVNGGIPSSGFRFLNDTLNIDDIARTVDYMGWASNLRFWSKSMSMEEWKEHARNPKCIGVENPKINYNFVTNVSGSFEKLRLDTLQKQTERYADENGKILFRDFSLNGFDTTGGGFDSDVKAILGDIFAYSFVSPSFDEVATDEKIRIRGFSDQTLLDENPWAVPAPTYLSEEILLQEEPQDDLRLSIEFSMVDSLDKDISNMFSSLDSFNDYLGRPELMFSPDYPDLEILRDVYFNRLSGKPDFRKFLEFYRWFDMSISSFVEQLVPSKTAYKGTNYVVESHMLERHKNSYRHSGNYLGKRQVIEDSLLLQQIVGRFKKY